MLVIRLMRTGKIHAPHYRVVVQERRSKLNGKAVETIGHYHPAQAGKVFILDKERANYWLGKGAQPSDTVANLLVKEGVLGKERKVSNFFNPAKKESEVKTTPAAVETPAAEETVTPAEEISIPEEEVATPVEEPVTPEADASAEETAPEADTAA